MKVKIENMTVNGAVYNILKLGKVPFYCAAWSNIKSVRNAIKCGFRPAWVELTARDTEFVDKMILGEDNG